MKFNPKARLDTKQIRDRRGRATSGGGRLPGLPTGGGGLPSGLPVGGGIMGVIIALVIAFVVWKSGGGEPSGSSASTGASTSSDSDIVERCQTGADANKYEDCAIVADVNSIQSYWTKALPQQTGTTYTAVPTTWFTGSTSTGCGNATSTVGPFYYPADKVVYIDLTFFHDMLQGQLGAAGGPFAEAYVLAHEYGHHVQDLLGTMDQVKARRATPYASSCRPTASPGSGRSTPPRPRMRGVGPSSSISPRTTSTGHWTLHERSGTTGSSSRRRAASTLTSGRMDRLLSGSTGSRSA